MAHAMKWVTAILIIIVLGLVGLGISVQASVSNIQGMSLAKSPTHFLVQQVIYFVVALVAAGIIAAIKPSFWAHPEMSCIILVVILVGLVSVHVPGLGRAVKGSARWISLPGITLQPSEFIKLAVIILMAGWLSHAEARNILFTHGVLPPVTLLGIVAAGFAIQPDLGSIVMMAAVNGPLLLVSGVRFRHLVPFAIVGLIVIAVWILNDAERMSRITSVMNFGDDTEEVQAAKSLNQDDDGYQVRQSVSALRSGGLKGVGYGKSVYKQRYLPENHTDFILAMVGEELGFIATCSCVVLFWLFFVCGVCISFRAATGFERLLSFGMTLHIGLCAGVNIGVVTGLFPTKGLALPFLSYGGSNLVCSLIAVGFIVGIGWRSPARAARPRSQIDPERKVWIS